MRVHHNTPEGFSVKSLIFHTTRFTDVSDGDYLDPSHDMERVDLDDTDDPRGYTVKLSLPSGRSNHWGGETWGVPQ